jgi:glycosyltransferase involved in cell wall biosynthesis
MEVADHEPPEPKKRILYVITKANWGGAQHYVFDMALGAKECGHDVLVVSGAHGELTRRLTGEGIASHTIEAMERDVRFAAEWKSFVALLHIIDEFKPDVLHCNSSKAGAFATLAGRIQGVPMIVFTAHAWAFNEHRPLWQRIVIGIIHYLTVLLSHRTICVSDAIYAYASRMPFVQNRLYVVANGIEPGTLITRGEARTYLAPQFVHTYPDTLWVGTVAELHPTKGLDILIEAFRRLSPSAVLVIIGEGHDRHALEARIEASGVADRIMLVGFVKDAAQYLSALDIFVLPSRSEAFGYSLLEAGLASLPCAASNVGGIPEIIKDKESGILVPPNDSSALADALHLLLTNEPLRQTLGNALYERVTRVFSKEKMLRETLALYER